MKSMTGYGNSSYHDDNFDLEIEMKSVNSRYLDLKINSPRELQFLDNIIKEQVSKTVKRAKMDIRLYFLDKRVPEFQLDENKLIAYKNLLVKAKNLMGDHTPVTLENILVNPDILSFNALSYNEESFIKIIMEQVALALEKHQEMANKEGNQLKEFFMDSYHKVNLGLQKIEESIPQYKERTYEILKENIENILKDKVTEDQEKRLFMEAAVYVDRSDVTEEIIRLKSHLKNYREKLDLESTDMGKSLNFIFQEMQREINTVSSKYNQTNIFEYILLIKEEVEKCREQIQNVE